MRIKQTSKIICTLVAIILFANPVLAAMGDLFPFENHFNAINSQSPSMSCHDDMATTDAASTMYGSDATNINTAVLNRATLERVTLNDKHQMKHYHTMDDCCIDICQCDDAGCHVVSLLFDSNTQTIYSSHQAISFNLPLYISLTSLPSSPPPII